MMKSLLRHLLLLVILFGGVGQLFASTDLPKENLCASGYVSASENNTVSFVSSNPSKRHQEHTVHVLLFESEEDDELISFKKRVEDNYYLLDICFGKTTVDYFRHTKIPLLPYLSFSSDRYLLIQVFRI